MENIYIYIYARARSSNWWCNENAAMRSLCILTVDLSVPINILKPFGVAWKRKTALPLALLSIYKTFPTAVNNMYFFFIYST